MDEILRWAIAGLLAAIFAAANYANLRLILGHYARADGTNPSPVLFVGGLAGAVACAIAPNETLQAYFWVPLALDLGTGPYLILVSTLLIREAFASSDSNKAAFAVKDDAGAGRDAPRERHPKERAIVGCILGTAVADALGLALEGLSRRRQARMVPALAGYKLLPLGKGMCSDDTEHTCMLAQSLIATAGRDEPETAARRFASSFGWRLRFWLLGMPAGIGLATLRAIVKLWIGFPPRLSGVYSAGNGPAMRIALIGVCYGDDLPRMRALVRAATRITHTDPKAERGTLAVALAAHLAATAGDSIAPGAYLDALTRLCGDDAEFMALARAVAESVARGESAEVFAASLGCGNGVTGYIYHTVPVALHVWLRHLADYRAAVVETVRLGGDSDTVAAVVGALVGARVGKAGIPPEWLRDLWEWPRTPAWMEALGARVAESCARGAAGKPLYLNPLNLMLRNALFIPLVLAHGFRRLLPPY